MNPLLKKLMLLILVTLLSGCCPWCGRKEYNEAKAKMAELCVKDGGNTVFSTVRLASGEKFTEEGYPPMYRHFESENELGEAYLIKLENEYLIKYKEEKIVLIKSRYQVINKQTKKMLGASIRYELVDGYAIEGSGGGKKIHCPDEGFDMKNLYKRIFIESD